MSDTSSTNSTAADQQAWTIKRLLQWTTTFFQERRVEGGRLAAELSMPRYYRVGVKGPARDNTIL